MWGHNVRQFPRVSQWTGHVVWGLADGFVIRFPNGGGAPTAGTLFGTNNYDQAYFVQIDNVSQVYIYGQSIGNKFVTPGTYNESPLAGQFVACFTPDLDAVVWHTRVGDPDNVGDVDISPTAFLISECGEIYLSGWGGSANNGSPYIFDSGTSGMPVTEDAFQSETTNGDFWLAVMSQGGTALNYATFFGGDMFGARRRGHVSFRQERDCVSGHVRGMWGQQRPANHARCLEFHKRQFQLQFGVFKFELGELDVGIDVANEGVLCDGLDVDFENTSTPGYDYLWTFDDNSTSDEFEPSHTFPEPGTYNVILTVTDPTGCLAPVNTDIEVNIESPPQPVIFPVDPVCAGEEVELIASGTAALTWIANPLLADLSSTSHTIVPPVGTTQFSVTDSNVCGEGTATTQVIVQEVVAEIIPAGVAICVGESVSLVADGADLATWSPPAGLDNPNANTVEASPSETTTYSVVLTDDLGCTDNAEATVTVVQGPPGDEVYPSEEICQGFGVQLSGAEGDQWLWSPAEFTNDPAAQNPYVSPDETTTFTVSILNICGIGTDEVTVEVNVPEASTSGDGGACRGSPFGLCTGQRQFHLLVGSERFGIAPNGSQTNLSPDFTTTYTVYVTDSDGCTASDELTIYITQPPPLTAGPDRRVALLNGAVVGGVLWLGRALDAQRTLIVQRV